MILDLITVLSVSVFVTYTVNEIGKVVYQDIQTLAEKIASWII